MRNTCLRTYPIKINNKNSSEDETANVNVFTTISHTYYDEGLHDFMFCNCYFIWTVPSNLLNKIGSLFGILKYVCDIVVKNSFTFAILSSDEFLLFILIGQIFTAKVCFAL